jgi:hypothetical protein
MAEGGEQPAGSSKREADYLERRHQAASSPSIMDMSEDELNEAIAAINRRLETSWQGRSEDCSSPVAVRNSASCDIVRPTVFDGKVGTGKKVDFVGDTAGEGSGHAGQWGANAASLLASPAVRYAVPANGYTHRPIFESGPCKDAAMHHEGKKRRTLTTIKLEPYNGTSPLETHLAKLNNCADYYNWTLHDRLCHLKASLEGHAGQVLWELEPGATEEDIVKLLSNRYGNVYQMERFRAELCNRRRKRGESIQSVYQDIRRLLALGFPGQSGELCEIIGRDAFLEALADPALRIRVLDQQPVSLDEALAIVCRMEAYSGTGNSIDDSGDDSARRRVRAVGATAESDDRREAQITRLVQQVERSLAEQQREIRQLRADVSCWKNSATASYVAKPDANYCPPSMQSPMSSAAGLIQQSVYYDPNSLVGQPTNMMAAALPSPAGCYTAAESYPRAAPRSSQEQGPQVTQTAGRRQNRRLDRDTCAKCGGKGHWQRSCPHRDHQPTNTQAIVGGVSSFSSCSEKYLEFDVNGTKGQTLIDSGCDRSVIPLRMVRYATLRPTSIELFAANGSKIPVLGSLEFNFTVQGKPLHADLLVSDAVDEFMLSYQWLAQNHCRWLFDEGILEIDGMPVELKHRPARNCVRRVYVREVVSIPPDMQVNVPVRMPINSFRTPSCDWLVEPKEIKPGLLIARTLLPNSDQFAAVRLINISGKMHELNSGLLLGFAQPGSCIGPVIDICGMQPANRSVQLSDSRIGQGRIASGQSAKGSAQQSDSRIGGSRLAGGLQPVEGSAQLSGGRIGCRRPNDELLPVGKVDSAKFGNSSCDSLHQADLGENYSHVKPIIDSLPAELTDCERQRAVEVIMRNADVFSKHEFDIGCTDLVKYRIDTGDHRPIAEPLRPHARVHLDVIDETVDKMLAAGIVEESSGPWSFNCVVVARPGNNTPRITIDYRRLNEITLRDQFPIARVADCLDALSGSVYFSVIDMSSSFYQIEIDECDRDKTSFRTRKGQFRFKRMPLGGVNSSSVFSRLMSLVLKGLSPLICVCFIDDCAVVAPSFDEAVHNIEVVLERFRAANLKLKPSKCKLFQLSIKFLGHRVSRDGIQVDNDKVACIQAWKFPKSISELRGFISLCSYYRSFCPGFSTVAEPLTEMLRKGVPLQWSERRQNAF